jgi:hypothetical protein
VGLSGNNDWGGSAANNFISPHGFESFHREVERKRLGVNVAFEADLGEGFTLIAEGFYAKLDEYNRAAGINISNRWDGGAFGVWTTPTVFENTGQTSTGNGRPWLAVDEYDINAWWVNSFTVNRTTKSETKNYNLELNYDNGGNFTSEVRAIRANGDRLSMNGQAQGDLSNWQYARRPLQPVPRSERPHARAVLSGLDLRPVSGRRSAATPSSAAPAAAT